MIERRPIPKIAKPESVTRSVESPNTHSSELEIIEDIASRFSTTLDIFETQTMTLLNMINQHGKSFSQKELDKVGGALYAAFLHNEEFIDSTRSTKTEKTKAVGERIQDAQKILVDLKNPNE